MAAGGTDRLMEILGNDISDHSSSYLAIHAMVMLQYVIIGCRDESLISNAIIRAKGFLFAPPVPTSWTPWMVIPIKEAACLLLTSVARTTKRPRDLVFNDGDLHRIVKIAATIAKTAKSTAPTSTLLPTGWRLTASYNAVLLAMECACGGTPPPSYQSISSVVSFLATLIHDPEIPSEVVAFAITTVSRLCLARRKFPPPPLVARPCPY